MNYVLTLNDLGEPNEVRFDRKGRKPELYMSRADWRALGKPENVNVAVAADDPKERRAV